MDIKQLEVFITVSKHGSFSKAARELFLTQPTVSSHIQNLENELQTVLLNRSNKTISLTDSGEILYKHAITILNDCKKAMYDIKEYSGKIEGSLEIVCSSIPEAYIFPEFIKKFCDKYPNITFTLNHCDSDLVVPEILSERVAFGIVGSKPKHPNITAHPFIKDELILICPKDCNIESEDGFVDPSILKKLTFLLRKEGSGTRNVMAHALEKQSIKVSNLNVRAHSESNEAIIEMVQAGIGCSFVSKRSVEGKIARGEIKGYKVKNIDLSRNFYLLFSKKKIFTPTESKFLEYFCENYSLCDTPSYNKF
ncbi:selenium metabolism-associated LysR family transcriptional regulator [Peptostreptococcus faecalis]|uniref:selenium metabolism-associated LysR family transcriptional regulator n=1 Tax=Peptostreptococcus faecalis TaxID=2045015 RepID=UPI000C7E2474|nr:selenium metabolism-associated LysR family transcriptional regulator [Peptostreptococcus faecalis]